MLTLSDFRFKYKMTVIISSATKSAIVAFCFHGIMCVCVCENYHPNKTILKKTILHVFFVVIIIIIIIIIQFFFEVKKHQMK